jgi:hypothetical protein
MKLRYFHLAVFPFSTIYLVITPMRAELRLTSVITDHAVLQSDAPIHTVGRGLTGGEDHAIHLHHCQGGPPPSNLSSRPKRSVARDLHFALMEKRGPEAIRPRHFRCARR